MQIFTDIGVRKRTCNKCTNNIPRGEPHLRVEAYKITSNLCKSCVAEFMSQFEVKPILAKRIVNSGRMIRMKGKP